jgi:hypothetical protein
MVTGLSKPLDHNEPFEFESDNETAEVEIDLQLSMQENLGRAIDKEMNSKICSKSRTTSLHGDSVDMLTFLRGYFKIENN